MEGLKDKNDDIFEIICQLVTTEDFATGQANFI